MQVLYVSQFSKTRLSVEIASSSSILHMQCFILFSLAFLILEGVNAVPWHRHRNTRQTDTYGRNNYGCECGKKNSFWTTPRIVGGREAFRNEFPWMAGIISVNRSRLICGASIINDRYVLTAAHCIPFGFDKNDMKVSIGTHNSCGWDETTTIVSVEEIFPHPSYDKQTNFADIMLVKLVMKITFNNIVRPICLPKSGLNVVSRFGGQAVSVVGWGLSEDNSLFDENCGLRVADLTLFMKKECITDVPALICAGHMTFSRGTCGGDSGGPLQLLTANYKHILIGITSNGYICANVNDPDYYTEVARMIPWILKTTRDATYCWR